VRGDSLRDLYAKTLALFGLAILAGVGALVDYWPASGALPVVASPTPAPTPARLPAVATDFFRTLSDSAWAADDRPAVSRFTTHRPAMTRRAPVRRPVEIALDTLPMNPYAEDVYVGEVVTLGEPPVPPAAVTPVVATHLAAPEIDLPPAPLLTFGPSAPNGQVASPNGFFDSATSAVKKTGESIVNTTVKTGSQILKAFGFVGGAFKKVI
jgi:hypothetical protein